MEHLSRAVAGDGEPRRAARQRRWCRSTRSTAATWSAPTNWVGVDVPAHCTALGKVLYAFGALALPPGNLERRTAHSPVDRAQFDHALVEVRRRGWAASLDELELGLAAVGAPVRAVDGTVVAAVSVSGPTTRDQRLRHHQARRPPGRRDSAACRRCWATNRREGRRRHDGPRGDPAGALRRDARRQRPARAGADPTRGSPRGIDAGVDAVRRADPLAGGGRRPVRARRLLRARDAGGRQGDERRAGHPAPAARRDRRADRRHVPDEHGQGRRARHRQEPGEHHAGGRGLPRDRPRGAGRRRRR